MARGRFGRRRGTGGNMTALIASLLKEQRAAQDRVMFDAYQNGGLVDGKPVTDGRILGYIKQRRDGFDRQDPLWDEWNNRHIQYGFSIGESKIQLAFQQGKASAGAVAAFYRRQLRDIPKDSAFYRTVAGRAAQWAKSASGAARGRARGRATAGLRDKLNAGIYKSANYGALESALTDYARREGIISGNQQLLDAKAADLHEMFDRGLQVGGKPFTFDDFQHAVRTEFKNLGGQYAIQLKLGNQGTEYKNRRDKFFNDKVLGWNTLDEREQYEGSRAMLEDDLQAAGEDPYRVAEAYRKHLGRMQGVLANAATNTGKDLNSSEFIGGIQSEIRAMETGQAPQGARSVASAYGESSSDLTDIADSVKNSLDTIDKIDKGQAYFGQETPGGPLKAIAFPPGVANNPLGLDKSLQPSIQRIDGEPRLVYLKGQAVQASTIVDANNQPVDINAVGADSVRAGLQTGEYDIVNGGNVGYVFVNPTDGSRKYGVIDPTTGKMSFTASNPFNGDPIVNGTGGLSLFVNGVTPQGRPDTAGALNPAALNLADPVLSDGPIAPTDLMNILQNKPLGLDLSEADVQSFAQRLSQREADRQRVATQADLGLQDRLGIGRQDQRTTGGGGDLRTAILDTISSIGQVTQSVFGTNSKQGAGIFTPPPPPALDRPPTVGPVPVPARNVPPGQNIVPTVDQIGAGHGAGGSWAAPTVPPTQNIVPTPSQAGKGHGSGGTWGTPVKPKVTPITKPHEQGTGVLKGGY